MTALTSQQIENFSKTFPNVVLNEPMSKHTSFRIGGAARLHIAVATPEECLRVLETAESLNIPWYVYGGGSNLLVADEGYEGVIIQMADRHIVIDQEKVQCGTGAITAMVARQVVEAGLTGFEWAIGVPGTIGGAIYGDAGCYGGEMRDCIVSVDAYRLSDRQRVRYTKEECRFDYRESRFKHEPHLLFGCEMQFQSSPDKAASKARMEEIMKMRKEKQPLDSSSAGCVFKNSTYKDEAEIEILRRKIDQIPPSILQSRSISAGWLIDKVGMMGQAVGDISVSTKHGNFFINKGKGRAQDVLALISLVKMKVRDELGIELHEEVQLVGF